MMTRPFRWLVALPFLVACSKDPESTSADYLTSAVGYYQEGKLRAAEIELKNALVKDPRNAAARFLLGQVYLRAGDNLGAEKELQVARDLGVPDEEVLPKLATALRQSRQFDKVLAVEADPKLPLWSRGEILANHSVALLNLGRHDEAEAKLNESIAVYPEGNLAATVSAMLAMAEKDRERARGLLEAALQRDPGYAPALSVLGDLESFEGRPEQAMAAYQKAVAAHFDNAEDRVKLAIVYISLNQLEPARQEVERLQSQAPNFAGRFLSAGLLALAEGNHETALELFEETIRRDGTSRYPAALIYAATSAFKTRRIELAQSYADRYRAARPRDPEGIRVSAYILAKRGRYQEVAELLKPALESGQADIFTKNLLASALMNTGEVSAGIRLLESLATTDQASAQAVTRLGLSLLRVGEMDTGLARLQTAVELDPEFDQAALILALGYIKSGQLEQAIAEAEAYRARNPESHVAYLILGLVNSQIGNLDQAEAAFVRADSLQPGNPAANYQLALIAVHSGRLEAAKAHYQRILASHETDLGALIGLAKVAKTQADSAAVKGYLQEAISTNPDALAPRVLLARQFMDENDPARAAEILSQRREAGARNPSFLLALGEAEAAAGAVEQSNQTYRQLALLMPDSAEIHYLLARSSGNLGDVDRVARHLNRALEIRPDFAEARIASAKLAAGQGDWNTVERHLAALDAEFTQSEDVVLLTAAAATARKDIEAAKALLLSQLGRDPSEAVVLALLKTYLKGGDRQAAAALAGDWLGQHPQSLAVLQVAAEIALADGKPETAAEYYRAILEQSPADFVALNNLSEAVRGSSPQLSYQYATKARELAPENPAVLDTFAAAAVAVGNHAEATQAIEEALRIVPNDPTLTRRKAMILDSMGRSSR